MTVYFKYFSIYIKYHHLLNTQIPDIRFKFMITGFHFQILIDKLSVQLIVSCCAFCSYSYIFCVVVAVTVELMSNVHCTRILNITFFFLKNFFIPFAFMLWLRLPKEILLNLNSNLDIASFY